MKKVGRTWLLSLASTAPFLLASSADLCAQDCDDKTGEVAVAKGDPADLIGRLPADIVFASGGYDGVTYYYWLACCYPNGEPSQYHYGYLASDDPIAFDPDDPCAGVRQDMTEEEFEKFLKTKLRPDYRFVDEPGDSSDHPPEDGNNLDLLMFRGVTTPPKDHLGQPQISPTTPPPISYQGKPVAVKATSSSFEVLNDKTFVLYKLPVPDHVKGDHVTEDGHVYVLSEAHVNVFDPEGFHRTKGHATLTIDPKNRARRTDEEGGTTVENGPLFVGQLKIAPGQFPGPLGIEGLEDVGVYVITYTPEFGHPG